MKLKFVGEIFAGMPCYQLQKELQYNLDVVEGIDYEIVYNYIYMRYQDISRNESLVLEGYKKRAAEIWDNLQEYEVPKVLAKANTIID